MKEFKIPAKPIPPSPLILDVSGVIAEDNARLDAKAKAKGYPLPSWPKVKAPAPASSMALDQLRPL